MASNPQDKIEAKVNSLSLNDDEGDTSSKRKNFQKIQGVEFFMQASKLEKEGHISEAVKLYGKAYRLNPNVDHEIYKDEATSSMAIQPNVSVKKPVVIVKPKFQVRVPNLLSEIESTFTSSYDLFGFAPEITQRILTWVGITHVVSLEECALSCKLFYIKSKSKQLWRQLYQLSRACIFPRQSHPKAFDFRQMYFDEPRIRTDGIYICKMTYLRPGQTEGTFYQPVHMVTYYRYLRFWGALDGFGVVSLVTTEEPHKMIPLLRKPIDAQVIPFGMDASQILSNRELLKQISKGGLHTFKNANMFIGKYHRYTGSDNEYTLVMYDPQSTHNSIYEMRITIPPKKMNNIITCTTYSSLSPSTTLALDGPPNIFNFNIQEWGKFVFSRVRSYIS